MPVIEFQKECKEAVEQVEEENKRIDEMQKQNLKRGSRHVR